MMAMALIRRCLMLLPFPAAILASLFVNMNGCLLGMNESASRTVVFSFLATGVLGALAVLTLDSAFRVLAVVMVAVYVFLLTMWL